MKHKKWWALGAVLALSVGLVAVAALWPDSSPPALAGEPDPRQEEWRQIIDAIDPSLEPALFLSSDFPTPQTFPSGFRTIYELGIACAPYLLERLDVGEADGRDEAMLFVAAANNLHLEKWYHEERVNPRISTPKDYTHRFIAFLKTVPEEVRKICSSGSTLEEKFEQLDYYGMAAVPFLADRIANGETEWEPFIAAQTLGLEPTERFQARLDNDVSSYAAKSALVAADADPAQWIQDNQQDLDILKRFMQ